LFSLVVIAGSWKYALAIHFWTLSTVDELNTAMPSLRIAGTLVKWGPHSSIAMVLLNFGYALLPRASRLAISCYLASEPQRLQKASWNT
jgi:hypothetical protein